MGQAPCAISAMCCSPCACVFHRAGRVVVALSAVLSVGQGLHGTVDHPEYLIIRVTKKIEPTPLETRHTKVGKPLA